MNSRKFKIIVFILIIILFVSSFYMFGIHVPYSQYHNQQKIIRNEICEKNNYQYDGYFYEHHGKDIYYILRIKMNNEQYYVVYDSNQEFVDGLKGPFVSEDYIKEAIKERYDILVDKMEVGYENNKFVYYVKIQAENKLTYLYYSLQTGEFIKAYYIED